MHEKKYDIFISYRHNCGTAVRELCHRLKKYYNVFWDGNLPSGKWAEELKAALNDSKVVLINLTFNSLEKNVTDDDWFYNEINHSIKSKEEKYIIPVYYDGYKIPNAESIEGLNETDKKSLKKLNDCQGIKDEKYLDGIVKKTVEFLDELGIRTKTPYTFEETEEYLEFEDIHPIPSFVGRKFELKNIDKLFQNNNTVFLSGIGGMGKTELAKKYAEEKYREYRCIFCKYDRDIEHTLASVEINGNSETDFNKKKECLKKLLNEEVLLIIDNFDLDYECDDIDGQLYQLFEGVGKHCKKLITTRNDFSEYEGLKNKQVDISTLSYEELKEIFGEFYKENISDEQFEKVLDHTESLTIAIPVFASLCAKSGMSIDEFCTKISGGIKALENSERINYYKDGNKRGTAPNIIRALFNFENMSEGKKAVLRNLSLLQFMYVTKRKYKNITSENLDNFDELVSSNWIKKIPGVTENTTYYELHPIINDLVREDLKPNPENCKKVFEYANKFALEKELFYEKNNVILANHELLFDESEKTEWLEALLNNLDLTVESNYEYTTSYLDKIGYNRALIMKLKAILLNKGKYSNSDFEAFCYCVRESKETSSDKQFVKLVVCKAIEGLECIKDPIEALNVLNKIKGYVLIAQVVQAEEKGLDLRKKYEKLNHTEEADLTEKIGKSDCFHDALMWVIPGEALAGFYTYNVCDVLFEKFLQPNMRDEEIIDVVKELEIVEWAKNNFKLSYVWAADIIKAFIRRYAKCRFNVLSQDKCRDLVEKSISYDYELFCYRTDDLIYALSHYMSGNHKDFEKYLTKYLNLVTTDQEALLDFCADLKKTLCQDYKVSLELLLTPISNHIEYIEKNLTEYSDYVMICEKWYEWAIELASNTGNSDMEISYSEKLKTSKENRKGYKLK